MNKKILIVDSDKKQCQWLCRTLEERQYETMPVYSLADLEVFIQELDTIVVILDIDTVAVDNRTIRELTLNNPGSYFLCLSKDRFHPELKDAICYHIYACINKPIAPDELFYLLESIFKDETSGED
jgi:DNA-binding NtrC family response regulator